MELYSWIIGNKEWIKIIYALIIISICGFIVYKSDRLFRMSFHKGIRYFRNAFLFFGIGFAIRYILGDLVYSIYPSLVYYSIITVLFEYFLIMAGFFLLYSLLWKQIENHGTDYSSSLFNSKIAIFHFISLAIAFFDYLWQTHYLMFFSQIVLFIIASLVSYLNYARKGARRRFLKFYFIAMLLSLIAWTLNALAALYFNWNQAVLINIYILNMVVFLLFLYGVIKLTKIKSKNSSVTAP